MKNLKKLNQGTSRASMPNLDRMRNQMPGFFDQAENSGMDSLEKPFIQRMMDGVDMINSLSDDDELGEVLIIDNKVVREEGNKRWWDGELRNITEMHSSKDGIAFTKERLEKGSLSRCPNCSKHGKPVWVHYNQKHQCYKGHTICSECSTIIWSDGKDEIWSCKKHMPRDIHKILERYRDGLHSRPQGRVEENTGQVGRNTGGNHELGEK